MTFKSKGQTFKSKYITAELAHLFSQSDSEEEEFEGFSDDEVGEGTASFNGRRKRKVEESVEDSDGDTGFYSDGDEAPKPKRRSLLVALRFPLKEMPVHKQKCKGKMVQKPLKNSLPVRSTKKHQAKKESEEEDDVGMQDKEELQPHSLAKRDKNIKENKEMLAKLFADLGNIADLTPPSTPQRKKRSLQRNTPQKAKLKSDVLSERRNPSRKARPPENFAVEEKSDVPERSKRRAVDLHRLLEVDEDAQQSGKRRRGHTRKRQFGLKSVAEITKEDLRNIAYRAKDKIWDKEYGSSCHQCRQKTLDTKTVCRSGFCVGVKGQFCGPCLKNRYGEDVRDALLDPNWSCPICRRVCNCSLCRKKEGRCATGILVGLARYNGHDNVHEYLERIQKELK